MLCYNCTEATPDHNNGTGTSAIETAQDDPIQHTEDTVTGPTIKGHMAYFIGDQDSKKGKDSNMHIIDGIHNIKEKHMLMFSFPTPPTNTSPSTKGNT